MLSLVATLNLFTVAFNGFRIYYRLKGYRHNKGTGKLINSHIRYYAVDLVCIKVNFRKNLIQGNVCSQLN